jgi:hypothetical protein
VVPTAGSESTSRVRDSGDRVVDAFGHARDAVVAVAGTTAAAIQGMAGHVVRPERVEVEFGLKFTAQGHIVVAGASAEASLVVRVTYPGAVPASSGASASAASAPSSTATPSVSPTVPPATAQRPLGP